MHNIAELPTLQGLLLEDHVLVAEGLGEILRKILGPESSIDIFHSAKQAKLSLDNRKIDFIITDLMIPGDNIIEFIKYCRLKDKNMAILVVTGIMEATSIKSCLAAGANAYLSKTSNPHELKQALEYSFKGKTFISSDLSGLLAGSILARERTNLTSKELEVLVLFAKGNSTKKVAEALFVSPITIMTHKRNIMSKLNIHSIAEMVKYVYENNLI
ncbi:MAG: hypothetical protein ABS46_07685 [Cytophagaceae bacterium SCN 52-12]|nr:MAG: hypothetical protein ABS46_07685 [Cytophagaceae bacterium SCN 52-12]